MRGNRRGPPQLWGAICRIGTSSALLPVFLLEVRTLGGLPAHNSAVHRLVVDFEVWQIGLSVDNLTVVCQPLVNEAPDGLYKVTIMIKLASDFYPPFNFSEHI